MKQKKEFTLEFHYDERTRWLADDQELIDQVRMLNYSLAAVHTDGAKPMVNVCLVLPDSAGDTPEAGFCFCKSCLVYSEPGRDHLGRPTCKHCHSTRVRLLTPEELLPPTLSAMGNQHHYHANTSTCQ